MATSTRVLLQDCSVSEEPIRRIGSQLRMLRKGVGLSQSQLAREIGMHQSALARMEQQDDLLVSSLVAYLRGVGASLEILARFTGASPTKLRRKQSTSLDAAIARRRSVGSSGARDVVFSIKPE